MAGLPTLEPIEADMARIRVPRFTVRRLMVAVAIVGIFFGMWVWMEKRKARFQLYAELHLLSIYAQAGSHNTPDEADPNIIFHRAMVNKYEQAARFPWYPVAPDNPAPN